MEELLEHIKNTVIKNEMNDKIIILNVGGIKFETTRSSLIAYPETTLGQLFNPKNPEAPKPINPSVQRISSFKMGNRIGNKYFKIPIDSEKRAAHNLQQGVTVIDKFCEKLIPFINEAISRFISEVKVGFMRDGCYSCCEPFNNYENGKWYEEFKKQGYALLSNEKIVSIIEKQLKKHFSSIKVKTEFSSYGYLVVYDFFDIDTIVNSFE
ncbi:4578_t:CDS:2 [Racocetra fulgida]|uniref:4578_t:CDS:1 n=1 Tax=Racocetra fulgida TaxID=60492 RepID=A0A9N9C4X9_9GLOM|nr:4578_t:CDS:2 [Racocetra fulgida]